MLMYKTLSKEQAGAVSMITVIFISVILTILTTSFIRLTINEQRESIDDDLTTRAYYAAQSGVQDAITSIKKSSIPAVELATYSECTPASGTGLLSDTDGLDAAYTCQVIDLAPSDYQAFLAEGETVFFKLDSGADDIQTITISWHIKGDGSDSDGSNVVARTSSNLPVSTSWGDGSGANYPAMIRTQLIAIPQTNVNRGNILSYVGFLNPQPGSSVAITPGGPGGLNGGVSSSDCDFNVLDGDYICKKTINIGSRDIAEDFFIRLQALYTSTHIKIVASNAGGPVNLLNAQALIDVTGRAGDVYRRVEERVDLDPDDLWPNYAILSEEEICKNFVITDQVTDFATINSSINGSCRP